MMGYTNVEYTELVAVKNSFLDYLIDKYNEDPKEEFILQYLDKCSIFEDFTEFGKVNIKIEEEKK